MLPADFLALPTPDAHQGLSLICYSNCSCLGLFLQGGWLSSRASGSLRAELSAAAREEVSDISTLDVLVPAPYTQTSLPAIVILWIFPFGLPKSKPALLSLPKLAPFSQQPLILCLSFPAWPLCPAASVTCINLGFL